MNVSTPNELSPKIKQAFIRLIAQHTGLVIRERDQANLQDKLFARMKAIKLTFPEDYYLLLNCPTWEAKQEWKKLVVLLTNLESYFFRDKEQCKLLKTKILPELIQRHQVDKTLRLCSAGCSTGEEAYSLAIMLNELIPDIDSWDLVIFGIDINQEALDKAKQGIYRAWSLRSIDTQIKHKYFKCVDNHYHIDDKIKSLVKWQQVNLVKDPFPQAHLDLQEFDLIICRNVFIYFESSAIAQVLDKFYHALQPLGYLITGHSELYGQVLKQFQTNVFPESLVYQRQTESLVYTPLGDVPSPLTWETEDDYTLTFNPETLEHDLEKNTIKMQHVALNLLKQLPPDAHLKKLGNLTASELIKQLQSSLNNIIEPDSP
jgi:chemotaxis protein methyltransferase CheR